MSFDAELERIRAKKWAEMVKRLEERDENAVLMIQQISRALTDGVKHFSIRKEPLLTVKAVLDALLRDGKIFMMEPNT